VHVIGWAALLVMWSFLGRFPWMWVDIIWFLPASVDQQPAQGTSAYSTRLTTKGYGLWGYLSILTIQTTYFT
jgi:hypothetical protein